MKDLRCWFGSHQWERIGIIKPIRYEGKFSGGSEFYTEYFALGECQRCGRRELQKYQGRFGWCWLDEVTESEYMAEFEAGAYSYMEEK